MRSRGPLLWDVSLLAVLARCLLLLAAQNEMADEDVAVDVDAAGVGPRFFDLSVSLYSPALSVGGPGSPVWKTKIARRRRDFVAETPRNRWISMHSGHPSNSTTNPNYPTAPLIDPTGPARRPPDWPTDPSAPHSPTPPWP